VVRDIGRHVFSGAHTNYSTVSIWNSRKGSVQLPMRKYSGREVYTDCEEIQTLTAVEGGGVKGN
jgi:hypothetical protein